MLQTFIAYQSETEQCPAPIYMCIRIALPSDENHFVDSPHPSTADGSWSRAPAPCVTSPSSPAQPDETHTALGGQCTLEYLVYWQTHEVKYDSEASSALMNYLSSVPDNMWNDYIHKTKIRIGQYWHVPHQALAVSRWCPILPVWGDLGMAVVNKRRHIHRELHIHLKGHTILAVDKVFSLISPFSSSGQRSLQHSLRRGRIRGIISLWRWSVWIVDVTSGRSLATSDTQGSMMWGWPNVIHTRLFFSTSALM